LSADRPAFHPATHLFFITSFWCSSSIPFILMRHGLARPAFSFVFLPHWQGLLHPHRFLRHGILSLLFCPLFWIYSSSLVCFCFSIEVVRTDKICYSAAPLSFPLFLISCCCFAFTLVFPSLLFLFFVPLFSPYPLFYLSPPGPRIPLVFSHILSATTIRATFFLPPFRPEFSHSSLIPTLSVMS